MPERDWQKDWEMCRKVASKPWTIQRQRIVSPFLDASEEIVSIGPIEAACTCGDPRAASFLVVDEDIARFVAQAHPALSYWLQRVQELEEDVRVISAANRDLATAIQQLKEENARLRGLLEDIVRSPTTFEDERLDYVELQVDLETLKEARKLLG